MATKKKQTKKKTAKKVVKKKTAKKKSITKKTSKNKVVKKVSSVPKTKKKTVKKVTKKTTTKKKKIDKKEIVIALGDRYFWINEGPAVRDLVELRDALLNIKKEQFIHHVNGMKNDFAVWVEEVLCDKKCADSIRRSKTVQSVIKNIEKTLLGYHY